ncbi:MAG TPA: TonB-dependent receptor [Pyrinomonadaceae bacterium]|nr:TonB-dependent receptor [Pyrinomonadaceae bacterium]
MFHIPHGRNRADAFSHLLMRRGRGIKSVFIIWFLLFGILAPAGMRVAPVHAQDTVTGAFEGTVTNSQTGAIIAGASVQIINQQTGQAIPKTSDARGRFYQGLLSPGIYLIRVSATGYQTREVRQRLFITRTGEVVPVPVALDPAPAVAPASPTPTPLPQTEADTDVRARTNGSDGRQGGAFTEEEVSTLPLGSRTFTRSFDELTLLLPGVAPPPQTLGSVAGPGIGAGVGSSGQFSVNGLRSRANNFTVDGSDNNDEDIGVRRQGFVSLVPQPVESIREYQAITLLAPAQFGRNIGAQVNAVSKSGGSEHHGTLYGFLNTSQLNARNPFDTAFGNETFALRAGNNQSVLVADVLFANSGDPTFANSGDPTFTNLRPLTVMNQSGGKDSFTLGQGGFVLGGPLKRERIFYFISAEGTRTNATREESFAVPTVEERGFGGTGATGLPLGLLDPNEPFRAFPTSVDGDAIFSLFPFPNNPRGIYGVNTFTQALPAGGRGVIASVKIDGNFKLGGRGQTVTERYNFTEDSRFIPVTGSAIFSTLKPRVRTQNNSFYLNSELSHPDSTRPLFNQLRLSYGRTSLNFAEVRDTTFQVPSSRLPNVPFLLNAPYLVNGTLPDTAFTPNTGAVIYGRLPATTEVELGPVGQVNIAGFSPLGVDVFNFPQQRVNNTYQIADTLTLRAGDHSLAFGTDIRRTELNSDLPRNARPLITFNGAPDIRIGPDGEPVAAGGFITAVNLAAAGAASGFFQTLATRESDIGLRFYQYNFFGQDSWRVRRNLSLSFGLRYEYNTTPGERQRRIESSFDAPELSEVPGLRDFIGGRRRIFDPDRSNFAPRLGVAYAPNLFGADRLTIFRGGYGIFYDQILGAVVSQSRNVYPNFLTVNFSGGFGNFSGGLVGDDNNRGLGRLQLLNPSNLGIVQEGTLNRVNPQLSTALLVNLVNQIVTGEEEPASSIFGATLPARSLKLPHAEHYTFSVEQQLSRDAVLSVAYVGTRGRNLLRFSTPNLGLNSILIPLDFRVSQEDDPEDGVQPLVFGLSLAPEGGRPNPNAGFISRFETTARSRYDSLQLQLRGRLRRTLQYQTAYTFGKVIDDVSDVFDLAGASALPQDSRNLEGERGPANFDVRHRFSYNFVYDLPEAGGRLARLIFRNLQLAGTGSYQTGQPFTVNSIYDVNLDGNLTDRLNTTAGLERTGDRRQPLRLTTVDPSTLLAPVGENGAVGRNTFRAGGILDLNLALVKRFRLSEAQNILFRVDAFNFINRANYGIPVRFLEAPGFGQATTTAAPMRRIQFALKYSF